MIISGTLQASVHGTLQKSQSSVKIPSYLFLNFRSGPLNDFNLSIEFHLIHYIFQLATVLIHWRQATDLIVHYIVVLLIHRD